MEHAVVESKRYIKAIERNFIEIANAVQKRQVLITVEKYKKENGEIYFSGMSFFELSTRALFNDVIAHMIRILDSDKKSATFWYILYNAQTKRDELISYSAEKIKFLKRLRKKLEHVRNKTHFHIDKQGVLNPKAIWNEAGVSGSELGRGVKYLFDILLELRNLVRNEKMTKNNYFYNGDDVVKLLNFAKTNGLIWLQKEEADF